MKKIVLLMAIIIISSSQINAEISQKNLLAFIKTQFPKNQSTMDVKNLKIKELKKITNEWDLVRFNVIVQDKNTHKIVELPAISLFINIKKNIVAPKLIRLSTGVDIVEEVKPRLDNSFYKSLKPIAGDSNATHKIIVFSDVLCPYCEKVIPRLYKAAKQAPKNIALYYKHYPLIGLHPAAKEAAMIFEKLISLGENDKAISLYSMGINNIKAPDMVKKIAKKTGISLDISIFTDKRIEQIIKNDIDFSLKMNVRGTPTVYVDGEIDKTGKKIEKYMKLGKSN